MKQTDYYVQLAATTMSPCSLARASRDEIRKLYLCPGCGSIKSDVGAIDVQVQSIGSNVLTFVFGMSVGIARRDFLDALGPSNVSKSLFLGPVFDKNGDRIDEFATFRGRFRLVIRGDDRSQYRQCDICNWRIYSPRGLPYLMDGFPEGDQIYESQLHDFIVTSEIAANIERQKWKGVRALRLPVLSKPQDGRPPFWCVEPEFEKSDMNHG